MGRPFKLTDHQKREAIKRRGQRRDACRHRPQLQRQCGDDLAAHGWDQFGLMLKTHLDAVEDQLIATSRIPANAGHPLHRGTPRESFIKAFLEGHISAQVSIGTGEIIDATSTPRQPRNQFDIVVYRSDYPRLDLGGGINAFLAESVIATMEVKSLLTEKELEKAILSARNVKNLQRNVSFAMTSGYVPPGILSYVVAYDGPTQIATVYQWLKRIETKEAYPVVPATPNP
jgi:hypothetical protein